MTSLLIPYYSSVFDPEAQSQEVCKYRHVHLDRDKMQTEGHVGRTNLTETISRVYFALYSDHTARFNPADFSFKGLRLTHQPSPWIGDHSTFLVQPDLGAAGSRELSMLDTRIDHLSALNSHRPHFDESELSGSTIRPSSLLN